MLPVDKPISGASHPKKRKHTNIKYRVMPGVIRLRGHDTAINKSK